MEKESLEIAKRKNKLINLTLALISVVLVFGTLEIAARLYAYVVYGYQSRGIHWLFKYEPYLLTKTHDIPQNYPSKGDNSYRIIVLGGSMARLVPDDRMQKAFQKITDSKVEVINLAHGGYIVNQERITLLLQGIRLKPDLIITIDGTNDIVQATKTLRPGIHYSSDYIAFGVNHPFMNALFAVLRHSQLVNSINKLKERSLEKKAQSNEVLNNNIINHYVEALESVSIIAKGMGIPHIMVLQPYVYLRNAIINDEMTPLVRQYDYRKDFMRDILLAMNDRLSSSSFSPKTYYVDGNKAFDNTKAACFVDEVHLNLQGNEIFVEYIVDNAIKKGFKID